jgi:hypothetical protein
MTSVVLLTLVTGLLNLTLGYAVASRLGHAPPRLRDAWTALLADPPADDLWALESSHPVDGLVQQVISQPRGS